MPSWKDVLSKENSTPYFTQLMAFVESERLAGKIIYPQSEDVFNAFALTPLEDLRVVILGQDPYHGPNQAHGLSFSVKQGVKVPPSLSNIFKELKQDHEGFEIPTQGDLTPWAKQGVLLLNTVLTVEEGQAHSHAKKGWETYTDKVLEAANNHTEGTIFLLWGSHSQKKARFIDSQKHSILTAPHPSPLSAYRGFFGCKHFSQVNTLLSEQGKAPINWNL